MKVLHYEHMGVGVVLAEKQREMGLDARVLSSAPHPFGFKEDYLLKKYKRPFRRFSSILRGLEYPRYGGFDVLHSHDNHRLSDGLFNHYKGRIIQHYHDGKTQAPLYRDVPSLVSLPLIMKKIPNSTWCPIPVDTRKFSPLSGKDNASVTVGYCNQNTDPSKKQYLPISDVEEAVSELKGRALCKPLSNIIPHSEMSSYYSQLDIWVDRVGLDFYGFAAVEAAAMGIPVIAQISEEALTYVPNCPFIIVKDRREVRSAIAMLVEDETYRKTLGMKAREYAVEMHDAEKSANLCLNKYRELLE